MFYLIGYNINAVIMGLVSMREKVCHSENWHLERKSTEITQYSD